MKNYLEESRVLLEELERLDHLTAGAGPRQEVAWEESPPQANEVAQVGEMGRSSPKLTHVEGAVRQRMAELSPKVGAGGRTALGEVGEFPHFPAPVGNVSRQRGEEARDVERMLRRDSRRYDCGFFLY